ncbi:MAG: hypothetical protein ACF8XB_18115 [Planctomycetota bacterium JB042]
MAKTRRAFGQKLVRRRQLGEILRDEGLLDDEQLQTAMEEQKVSGGLFGEVLVNLGFVTEWEVAKCLVAQLQLPFIYTALYDTPVEAIDLLPHAFLHQHRMVPVDIFGKTLVLATAGNIDTDVIEEIEESTEYEVALYIALSSDIQRTLQERFPLDKVSDELAEKFDQLFDQP